ncbi:hypothetical protein SDRG_15199 [Saprolegnia diclina VS20]|uniref:Uncharacterized protein n=1 Tax=Saprolegnia diclina (strain VS20) TaxID=1156394 RepID=T0Q0X2_SAPDV|nr:hypothetical protein SDRG_15199 [Saprolegnia diclina VS20]EQC26985.1 hypothetical protein SDRG_15199 [Saprolegnia diclina VS20]|eukprot:XP_008619587.1 hypothetical protein SDRG_15199 [Saprolegnia diclina VS20]
MEKTELYEVLNRQLVELYASLDQMQKNLQRTTAVSAQTHSMSHAFLGIVQPSNPLSEIGAEKKLRAKAVAFE